MGYTLIGSFWCAQDKIATQIHLKSFWKITLDLEHALGNGKVRLGSLG